MSIHDHRASALLPALNGNGHANNGRGYEPSMERIADLSKKATAAAETAATDFRSLGEEIMALAGHIKVQCENAAGIDIVPERKGEGAPALAHRRVAIDQASPCAHCRPKSIRLVTRVPLVSVSTQLAIQSGVSTVDGRRERAVLFGRF